MAAHAREVGAEITWAVVEGILDAEAETKEVKCLGTSYFARSILIASGCQERHLGIPGEEEFRGQGVSYCAVCDGAFFQDCEIVVIGSGDSAFEEGDYLTRYGKKVTLLLRSERVHADRVYIERAEANPKMEVFKNRVVEEIIGSPANGVEKIRVHNVEDDSHYELECQAVFPFIGSVPNTKFLSDLSILDKQGFIVAQADMSTSIPGVYAAGDCRQKVLRQVITAGNDGAIAAQSIAAYLRSR